MPGKKNGRRIGLGKQEAERQGVTTKALQRAWLERKAAQGGFRLLNASSSPYRFQHSTKSNGEGELPLSHIAVQFDGTLQVTDPELFGRTVAIGIGSGKAFGFGLLSLAPI